ncbi:MAG: error-prone DNA polymerase [Pirellulales bacterium]
MPELPPAKRLVSWNGDLPRAAGQARPSGLDYAELHCKTNFSFLEGASHPDELAARAAELGYAALAVTDRHSLAGVVRAHAAAKECGLKLLIGAEIYPSDAPPIILLATNRAAYARLSHLLTVGRRRAPKGECQLTLNDIAEHAEGMIGMSSVECQVANKEVFGVRCSVFSSSAFRLSPSASLPYLIPPTSYLAYREIFPSRFYLLAELHRGPDDATWLARLMELSRGVDVPLAAAGDVHYHVQERGPLHDVLTAIRHGATVAEIGEQRFANYQRHLKPVEEIARRFAACPQALRNTIEIAGRCQFSLDELRYEYPSELCPAGSTPLDHLRKLTWEGAAQRYPQGLPEKVRGLLEHELALIAELHYEAYFLTVWDLVRFARSRDILCQGRGSAANSAVCFALEITSVDPARMDVLFERFISRERGEAPDIDVDFEHERREEVLQYIYDKYGRERAAMTAEVITYRPRSAVRDVAKTLGLSPDCVDRLAKNLDHYSDCPDFARRCRESGLNPASPVGRRLAVLVEQILGFPRHLSQHVGGMVITERPIWELAPIENAAMPGRTVIQWDKNDLDALGILKVDCLALGMLTAIHKCFDLVKQHHSRPLTLADVPTEDPVVYDMICRADTMGVFQIESRAQMSMLPRLRPRCFYDLVIEVAIVRPGPIQGDMVHPYLRRRNGEEPIEYPNQAIREVLKNTLGVPLFQEQAMRLAVVAAGFTPGEADQLRRAMGAWRRPGVIDAFRQKLIAGMTARGLSAEFAQRVFDQIRGFGEYGFPESHAASFALLVYVSAWLKHYYPAAFAAAIINSQPMGFYAPGQLVRDAKQHGVAVLPWDVNASMWDCTLETHNGQGWALRLGLRLLAGLPQAEAERMIVVRAAGPFDSLADVARRAELSRATLSRLAKADVFGSLEIDRRQALWQALGEERTRGRTKRGTRNAEPDTESKPRSTPRPLSLFAEQEPDEPLAVLPRLSAWEEILADYRTAGLSLRGHPLAFLRRRLDGLRVLRSEQLAHWPAGRQVRVAGLVLVRQRPSTAKGIIFVTLEDETGVANLIIRPDIWERYRPVAKNAAALLAHGQLQREHEVIHLLVNKLEDLATAAGRLPGKSRDFQ